MTNQDVRDRWNEIMIGEAALDPRMAQVEDHAIGLLEILGVVEVKAVLSFAAPLFKDYDLHTVQDQIRAVHDGLQRLNEDYDQT